ncbi:hypothetical protein P7F88_20000 [Vibrio hannami]|uniref:hypothetical protein n=1 Tax=Vibrio hannami TaxID=2717094 RepID=UPI0024101ABA|nr:hypothetical protein [Vibrio hannami]MDG3088228.1 hypothetical protein [Vibrio hannami]
MYSFDHSQPDNPLLENLIFVADVVLACLLVFLTLYLDIRYFSNPFSETSLTEFSAQLLLLSISIRFLRHSRNNRDRQNAERINHIYVLAGIFFTVLLIRELDQWFDIVTHGFWVYPALSAALYGLCYLVKHRTVAYHQLQTLLSHRFMPILLLGVVFLLVLSRIMGMGMFWKEVMGDDYMRIVKNVVEEGSELLAYYIIAIGTIKITKSEYA